MPPILLHLPHASATDHSLTAASAVASLHHLDDLAVFAVSGADAVSFIQGQITNDIASALPNEAKLAGYCTAQGRLLGTMILSKSTESPDIPPVIQAVIKQDVLAPVMKRLSMFVLRAKAKLESTSLKVTGIQVSPLNIGKLTAALGHDLPSKQWESFRTASGQWISAPAANNLRRWWWVASAEQIAGQKQLLSLCQEQSSEIWQVSDIKAGLPWIVLSTQDLFIPQTLNLDLIDGVSFTKGCYPGQEIVARSHYRGTLKKRMGLGFVANTDLNETARTALVPGSDIFDSSRPGQPCGRIINSAHSPDASHLLFEATFESMQTDALCLVNEDGPAIKIQSLPYSIHTEKN